MTLSARELIERAKNYMGAIEDAVALAYRAYDLVKDDVSYAIRRLEVKEKSDYPRTYANAYLRSIKSNGTVSSILKAEIDKAIEINDEFDIPIYKDYLYKVASDPDIYTLKIAGRGWNARLQAIISFESVAGSLEDWARGVSLYREALGIDLENTKKNSGTRATRYWYSTVFRKPLEVDTVQGRTAYAGRPASFWQILNNGSPASLPSDRGDGSFNPIQSVPTDFIGSAELRIKSLFEAEMDAEHELWKAEIKGLKLSIDEANAVLAEINQLILDLRADESLDRAIIAELNKRSRSGDISQYTDRGKLRKAIEQYRAGEKFTSERIELTAKNNAGKRVRPRVGSFIQAIESYGDL